jgi:hypothetical protein
MSASTPTIPIAPAGQPTATSQQQPTLPNIPSSPFLPQQQPNAAFPHTLALPPPVSQAPEDPSLQAQTTEEMMRSCRAFIEQLRSGSAPWLLQRLNNTYGVMPDDPDAFSYWMALVSLTKVSGPHRGRADVVEQVMPIDEFEKARLLPIRSPRLRLKLIVHWVESLRTSWW